MNAAKNISDGIDFGRSWGGGGVAYIYIRVYVYVYMYTWLYLFLSTIHLRLLAKQSEPATPAFRAEVPGAQRRHKPSRTENAAEVEPVGFLLSGPLEEFQVWS